MTNSIFSQVDMSKRVELKFGDVPTGIIMALWETKAQFDGARAEAKAAAKADPSKKRKRHDKTPW